MQETFEIHDDSLRDLLGEEPTITHLATGFGFTGSDGVGHFAGLGIDCRGDGRDDHRRRGRRRRI